MFIGQNLDQDHVTSKLNECLLTDEEYELGPGSWEHFQDPMPEISISDEEEESSF